MICKRFTPEVIRTYGKCKSVYFFIFVVLLAKGNLESTGKVVSSKRKAEPKKRKGGKKPRKNIAPEVEEIEDSEEEEVPPSGDRAQLSQSLFS